MRRVTTPGDEPAARTVGISELRAKASEIVREVRATGRPIDITLHGEVVARLSPSPDQPEQTDRLREARVWLDETEAFAQDIARRWPSTVSSVDLVREQRREL
jgi:prevent-host-death family protein